MDEKDEAAKPGPKPLHGERMSNRSVRLTDGLWAKLQRLGGSVWLRKQIERAKEPSNG